jgi:hypothetical protein
VPGRGSGIGLSMIGGGGLSPTGKGGSATSTRSGTPRIYGRAGMNAPSVHHYLWALVAVEMLTLIWLRHAFRRYHGG